MAHIKYLVHADERPELECGRGSIAGGNRFKIRYGLATYYQWITPAEVCLILAVGESLVLLW